MIVGLGICGVVINATSSAATLMGDFRTGYICLAAPRAMFGAQLVGQLLGALITPVAFMLFYRTGQVNVPGGPYPGGQALLHQAVYVTHKQLLHDSFFATLSVVYMAHTCCLPLSSEHLEVWARVMPHKRMLHMAGQLQHTFPTCNSTVETLLHL